MEQTEGKLKSLPLVEKLKLIEIIESGRSVKDVAEEYAMNRNTLHYILKNKEKIRDAVNSNPGTGCFKRIKPTKSPELEQRVLNFMYESRLKNERISGNVVKTMALEIANDLNLENFAASNGWLCSFFKRNQISINEFNQATDAQRVIFDNEKDACEYVVEEVIEEEVTMKEDDNVDNVVEFPSADFGSSENEIEAEGEEYFESEIIDEDDESQVESQVDSDSAPEWRNWCRLCGNRESLPEIDQIVAELAQQLFDVSFFLNCVKVTN